MDPRDLKEIDKFLTLAGAEDLFEYYRVPKTADPELAELAIQDRREWAQSRQSNPKYRPEAIWVIRNVALVRRALIDHIDAYREHVDQRSLEPRLRQLEDFIQGVLSAGGLTPRALEAIESKGKSLQIPSELLADRLAGLELDYSEDHAPVSELDDDDLTGPVVEVDDDPTSDNIALLETDDATSDGEFNQMPGFLAKKQTPKDELRDIVRGLMLQGMGGSVMESMVLRRGKRLGLEVADVKKIIEEVAKQSEAR